MWVWFGTMVGIRALHELQRLSFFRKNIILFTALLLIYVPLAVLWRRKERIEFFEDKWGQLLKSLGWFLLVALMIFPLVEIGNHFYQGLVFHKHYVGGNFYQITNTIFFNLLLVALPEEFFFRGYFQTQLNRIWGRPYRLLGADFGKSLFFTSFLFALSHSLIQEQWWHFSIFFPALIFGWLREKTDAITASVLFHALSNVYSYWVIINYH
jgi:CAAX protease family protein